MIKTLTNMLREILGIDSDKIWDNERTLTPQRVQVRHHSMALSTEAVVAALEILVATRSNATI